MLIEIVILILAIPVGFLIAYLANDELVCGRKWFLVLGIVSFAAGAIAMSLRHYSIFLTLAFILIIAVVSYLKSFDKKWTRRRV